tara:strand:- start:1561 stop:1743 length:183 start_codon:yes stop_codon:yes gene_type:complete
VLSDTLKAVREVLLLADKVDRLGQTLEKVAIEVNDQDKRIIRLEAFVEMAMINQKRIDTE